MIKATGIEITGTEVQDGSQSSTAVYKVGGTGPLLVYVAGLDGTGELFFKQAPALARAYRVTTFRSRESGQFTYQDLAADVATVIQSLGESRATIVAESFGGGVALWFAVLYPDMVEKLVVVNSFPRFRGRVRIRLAVAFASLAPFALVCVFRSMASWLGLLVDGVKREDRRVFFQALRSVRREGYVRRLKLVAELDVEERLCEIRAPALFIAAEKDLLLPSVKEAYLMAGRITGARVKVIRGAGHACLLNSRVSLAALIGD